MLTARVLVLGEAELTVSAGFTRRMRERGIVFKVTTEVGDVDRYGICVYERVTSYHISNQAILIAATASIDEYDAVIVGNPHGTGMIRALLLPTAMRERTLIICDQMRAGTVLNLRCHGFRHFGSRYPNARLWLNPGTFLEQIIVPRTSHLVPV